MQIIEFLENHRRAFLISGIAICVLLIILTISPNIGSNIVSNAMSHVVAPMQRGLSSAVSWVRGNFEAFGDNRRLIAENRDLLHEINRLEMENYRLQLAALENIELNEALNLQQRFPHLPTMGARVIGQDPNNWHRSFHIDRGTSDGVEQGMAIIADGGLAGVVRYANPRRAQFVSVLDSRFAAAAVSTRTEDIGTVRGDTALMSRGLMRMDIHSETPQIMPGDEIKTSPHSVIFPEGLLIGEVVSIHTNPDGTRYALIRPAADVNNLDMVLVITENFSDGSVRDANVREQE